MNAKPNPVEIELDHFHHQPFQSLSGTVKIHAPIDAPQLELRVFWFTRGRGDEEAEISYQMEIDPQKHATPFSFQLPASPYSFAGQLITLAWAVEVVDHRDNSLNLVPFLLSPTGEELQLEEITDNSKSGRLRQKRNKQFARLSQNNT